MRVLRGSTEGADGHQAYRGASSASEASCYRRAMIPDAPVLAPASTWVRVSAWVSAVLAGATLCVTLLSGQGLLGLAPLLLLMVSIWAHRRAGHEGGDLVAKVVLGLLAGVALVFIGFVVLVVGYCADSANRCFD